MNDLWSRIMVNLLVTTKAVTKYNFERLSWKCVTQPLDLRSILRLIKCDTRLPITVYRLPLHLITKSVTANSGQNSLAPFSMFLRAPQFRKEHHLLDS